MNSVEIVYPADFPEIAWEIEAKGWLEVRVIIAGMHHWFTFYDPVRLLQEIKSDHDGGTPFFEHTIVVVPKVTRAAIDGAVAALSAAGKLASINQAF